MKKVKDIVVFGWVGEDDLGSGEVGIKRALVPAGNIPMVAINRDKIDQPYIRRQVQAQASKYGKTIYLVKFKFDQVEETINPEAGN